MDAKLDPAEELAIAERALSNCDWVINLVREQHATVIAGLMEQRSGLAAEVEKLKGSKALA